MKFITIKSARGHSFKACELALEQLASKRFPLEKVTTHTFGLKDVDLAIKSVGGHGVPDVIHASLDALAVASAANATETGDRRTEGVAGFAIQDSSLQESMGPICDRTKENPVSTDNGIIMARHRMMRAAKALVDKGVMPPGIDPAHHKVRSAAVVLPPDQAFKDAAKEALTARPGVAQTTV